MAENKFKVGIISCSGEEIPGGTVARLATRRVLEALRPQSTVTLCLPLFLAGEESERRFARRTRRSPSTAATSSAPGTGPRPSAGRWQPR